MPKLSVSVGDFGDVVVLFLSVINHAHVRLQRRIVSGCLERAEGIGRGSGGGIAQAARGRGSNDNADGDGAGEDGLDLGRWAP